LAARIILSRLAPERLPTAGKEIQDLVGLRWKDLRTRLDEIRSLHSWAKAPGPVDERQLRELVWALIVLRSDPRASDPSSVDEYLGRLLERERAETRIEVVRLFRECQPQSRQATLVRTASRWLGGANGLIYSISGT